MYTTLLYSVTVVTVLSKSYDVVYKMYAVNFVYSYVVCVLPAVNSWLSHIRVVSYSRAEIFLLLFKISTLKA